MADRRPRIGFLTHGIWDSFGRDLWKGAEQAAREADVDLSVFICSNTYSQRDASLIGSNMVFDLADAENSDGFVVSASSLSHYVTQEKIEALYDRCSSLPMVSIAFSRPDIPSVVIDNYSGVYQLVSHLLEEHGRRRPVFVPGPWKNVEVQERYRGFSEAMRDHGLQVTAENVAEECDWTFSAARKSITAVIKAGRIEFDAVVAASDGMALGVIQELQAREITVPRRVSVVGFNDTAEAQFIEPPVTSVHQPVVELARRATALVAGGIRGAPIPPATVLPVTVIRRRSCGCLSHEHEPGVETSRTASGGSLRERVKGVRRGLAARLRETLDSGVTPADPGWTTRLINALLKDLTAGDGDSFQEEWRRFCVGFAGEGGSAVALAAVLSILRSGVLPAIRGREVKRLETVVRECHRVAGEVMDVAHANATWMKRLLLLFSIETGRELSTVTEIDRLEQILVGKLIETGIDECILSICEDPANPLETVRAAFVFRRGLPDVHAATCGSYRARRLFPDGLGQSDTRRSIVIKPLDFQERQTGFGVLSIGTLENETFEVLWQAMGSALQRLLLLRQRQEAQTALEKAYADVESEVRKRTAELEAEVTERRRAEEALVREQYLTRALTENTPDSIYFKDRENRYIRMNEALARHLGLESPEQGIGKSDYDFFAGKFAAKTQADEERVMQTGLAMVGMEELELWPDGREAWTSTTKLPLRNLEGKIVGTIGMSRDITERKRTEEEVRRLAEELEDRVRERTAELEAANRELEAFSYSVSHDLRAPLRAMDGFARILVEEFGKDLPSGAMRHMSTIMESARTMGRLIDGLLEFSRLSRQPLMRRKVRHRDLVHEALEGLRNEYEGREVKIEVGELPDGQGDPTLVRQIWANLIGNALKFTRRRDEAVVEIGSRGREGRTEYFVKDNGVGFDMKYAGKLFGVFQRLHRTEEYEGTGVGLATVHRIVARHGGRIWAEAEPDKGATFYFTL